MEFNEKEELILIFFGSLAIFVIGLFITIVLPDFSTIGGSLISISLVSLLFEFIVAKRMIDRTSEKIGTKFDEISQDIVHKLNLPLEKFYQRRSDIKASLEDEIKDYSEIWVAWHTGSSKGIDFVEKCSSENKKAKIILVDPNNSEIMKKLAKIGGRQVRADKLKNDIVQISDIVKAIKKKNTKCKIELKYFDGFIGNSVIIADPEQSTSDSWARVELIIPIETRGIRPSIKVTPNKGGETFKTIVESYKKLWKKSKIP